MNKQIESLLLKITTFIQQLNKKEFERYLVITLAGAGLILGVVIYFTYAQSSSLSTKIKRLQGLSSKGSRLLYAYEQIKKEEGTLQGLLNKYKDFNLKADFERFCKEQNINPEAGWNTLTESISPQFEEVILPATFKNQTTEKLVSLLEKISEKEIVYVKNLTIRTEKNKTISFDLTIATKRSK